MSYVAKKKNCYNCTYLEYVEAEPSDPSGFCCNKRDYFSMPGNWQKHEAKHLKQLESETYLDRPKKCCELAIK